MKPTSVFILAVSCLTALPLRAQDQPPSPTATAPQGVFEAPPTVVERTKRDP